MILCFYSLLSHTIPYRETIRLEKLEVSKLTARTKMYQTAYDQNRHKRAILMCFGLYFQDDILTINSINRNLNDVKANALKEHESN